MKKEEKVELTPDRSFSVDLSFQNLVTIRDIKIIKGDRWIYSAGFNVDPSLTDTKRIDIEIPDIEFLSKAQARVAILSHQGSWKKHSACHLDFIATYLSNCLSRNVQYFPENNSPAALERVQSMQDGEIIIFGNTRFNQEEERGSLQLAKKFSKLGDYVAIGGFSKAHRCHSSNTQILRFLPGYAASGLLQEIKMLDDLIKVPPKTKSIAIIGGTKIEKITKGLKFFKSIYDFIIPGGIVLNNILKAQGISIGNSYLGDVPDMAFEHTKKILSSEGQASILLPKNLVVARKDNNNVYQDIQVVNVNDGVPHEYMIADFFLSPEARKVFLQSEGCHVRTIIAGTPCLTKDGFTTASGEILQLISDNNVESFMMGGNTLEDLSLDCPSSTGGGAALHYLVERTCPVLEALSYNQRNPDHLNEF